MRVLITGEFHVYCDCGHIDRKRIERTIRMDTDGSYVETIECPISNEYQKEIRKYVKRA